MAVGLAVAEESMLLGADMVGEDTEALDGSEGAARVALGGAVVVEIW